MPPEWLALTAAITTVKKRFTPVQPMLAEASSKGVVNGLEGAVHVHEHQREKLQRLNHQNTAKAVDALDLYAEDILDKAGNNPIAPQQHDPSIGADKGGRHAAEDGYHKQKL